MTAVRHHLFLRTVPALLLLLAACSSHQPRQQQKVFYLNLSSGNLESLDPAFSKDLYTMWTAHMVYNTLVETDEALHTVPSLARSWEVSDDGLSYTFHLRSDVYFQDNPVFPGGKGRKMTAADVVYSFNRLIDPAVASSGAWVFNDRVAKNKPFTAINDTTLELRLQVPFRPMIQMLSMPYCSIVPHEVADRWGKDFRTHPCGTGPFTYRYWDEGNVLVLHKNARYWEKDSNGTSLPYIDAVQIGFIDSKATEFLLFLQGKIDFVNGIDGSFKDLVLARNGTVKKEFARKIKLEKSTYLNTEYLGILTDSTSPLLAASPLKNRLVRQAINYGIDRARVVTYFRNGVGFPATSGFIPRGMPGYDSTGSYGYHYDPQKALQLLEKAGYPRGQGLPVIKILTPDNYVDIVNFVGTQLQDIGIQVQPEVMQPNILKQQMSRSEALFFRAQWIADYPDAETYLAFFNSRFPAPPNYTRFKNARFDELYDRGMNLPDSVRPALYRQMDSLAMSYAPVVPLFYDQLLHFTQNRITGFASNPMNLIDIKRVQIK